MSGVGRRLARLAAAVGVCALTSCLSPGAATTDAREVDRVLLRVRQSGELDPEDARVFDAVMDDALRRRGRFSRWQSETVIDLIGVLRLAQFGSSVAEIAGWLCEDVGGCPMPLETVTLVKAALQALPDVAPRRAAVSICRGQVASPDAWIVTSALQCLIAAEDWGATDEVLAALAGIEVESARGATWAFGMRYLARAGATAECCPQVERLLRTAEANPSWLELGFWEEAVETAHSVAHSAACRSVTPREVP